MGRIIGHQGAGIPRVKLPLWLSHPGFVFDTSNCTVSWFSSAQSRLNVTSQAHLDRQRDCLARDPEVLRHLLMRPSTAPQLDQLTILVHGEAAASSSAFHSLPSEHRVQRPWCDAKDIGDGRDAVSCPPKGRRHRFTFGTQCTRLARTACGSHGSPAKSERAWSVSTLDIGASSTRP